MIKELEASALPLKLLNCEGGYFLMADISEFRSIIP
jgi:hypothetical protein